MLRAAFLDFSTALVLEFQLLQAQLVLALPEPKSSIIAVAAAAAAAAAAAFDSVLKTADIPSDPSHCPSFPEAQQKRDNQFFPLSSGLTMNHNALKTSNHLQQQQ